VQSAKKLGPFPDGQGDGDVLGKQHGHQGKELTNRLLLFHGQRRKKRSLPLCFILDVVDKNRLKLPSSNGPIRATTSKKNYNPRGTGIEERALTERTTPGKRKKGSKKKYTKRAVMKTM